MIDDFSVREGDFQCFALVGGDVEGVSVDDKWWGGLDFGRAAFCRDDVFKAPPCRIVAIGGQTVLGDMESCRVG